MSIPIKVFVASSLKAIAEGGPAQALRGLIKEQLRDGADVRPWTREFDLSAMYIESLELAAATSDFAIVMATPDDLLIQGDKRSVVPRDNVVFELGLFMGALGRSRCFVVQQDDAALRLPTDLLGIETAGFKVPADGNWKSALDYPSMRVADRIRELKIREKLTAEEIATRKLLRAFAEQVEGAWWERVLRDDREDLSALSFFTIEPDVIASSVRLRGHSYGQDGRAAATWNSEITRVDRERGTIHYAWTGRAVRPEVANRQFSGMGHMMFDPPARLGDRLSRGNGMFWNVDEAHPEQTVIKPTELRRISDDETAATMTMGDNEQKRTLVARVLEKW